MFYEIGLLATNRPILEGSDFCLPAGFLRHFFLDDRWEDELALADPYVWKTAITDRAPHGARVQAVLGSKFFDGERSGLSGRLGCHTNLRRGAHICTPAQHWTRLVLQRYFYSVLIHPLSTNCNTFLRFSARISSPPIASFNADRLLQSSKGSLTLSKRKLSIIYAGIMRTFLY